MATDQDANPAVKTRPRVCVRTGCNTCKVRKVKCDELRPQCARCTSTGRTCDGYVEPPPIQRRRSPKYPTTPKTLSIYRPHEHVSEDVVDRRCFAYFRCRVVQDISGCFEVDFWDRLVPQIGHAEPTVHHALLALSSLYECLSESRALPASPEAKLALKHYTKAVGLLATALASNLPSPQVVLVSCLVFVWFEFIQSNLDAALNHLQAGLHILKDLQSSKPIPGVDASLSQYFTRLHLQARQHGSPSSDFNANVSEELIFTLEILPSTFASLCHARSCLDLILDSLYTFTRRLHHPELSPFEVFYHATAPNRTTLEATRLSLLQKLQEWHSTFQNTQFVASPPIENAKTNSGVLLLQLHHLFACKIAQTAFWASEMAYDDLTADYEQIISLAGRLIHGNPASTWVGNTTTAAIVIYFDVGVIAPLFFVSIKCRHPVIRRTAISLLKQAPVREGMWLRSTCLQFAELKMTMEEDGHEALLQSGGTLPESVRINHEQAREAVVEGKRVTVLRYKRGGVDVERIVDMSAAMGELV